MASSPKAATVPAQRPVRSESAAIEDVVLGGADELVNDTTKAKGKRALSRPLASGVGLIV